MMQEFMQVPLLRTEYFQLSGSINEEIEYTHNLMVFIHLKNILLLIPFLLEKLQHNILKLQLLKQINSVIYLRVKKISDSNQSIRIILRSQLTLCLFQIPHQFLLIQHSNQINMKFYFLTDIEQNLDNFITAFSICLLLFFQSCNEFYKLQLNSTFIQELSRLIALNIQFKCNFFFISKEYYDQDNLVLELRLIIAILLSNSKALALVGLK
ncbi:unnamed protein product (macronuclear) [Paramecium tetraurelia]|uniref:Transmembrane protein n=1 Tax=Paramecium tetraurelia TaxID=5888 RepID=A0DA59_PARTE|nr:uncharacterized protein GSPATT00014833001 [Paramecium tetraurelia]CAK79926.1 unnamed protein product [Paramecium tetraurelia]|eukprot:XP_001447323.1 hypothetical protein (macronuclear) [Paramecium tetraurelia strain d4-2]